MKLSFKINPDNKPATWEQIKYWRNFHSTSPIKTSYGFFDFDSKSEGNIKKTLEFFDDLPTLKEKGIEWKMADNSVNLLSKEKLILALQELKKGKIHRDVLLHKKAEIFRTMPIAPTPKELSDVSIWLDDL